MSDSPEAIRADIEQTRRELGSDVDALADKVSPSKIVDRQTDKVKQAFGSVRERVMGAADDAGSAVATPAARSSMSRTVSSPRRRATRIAVGLIAFGAGLLLASLIPASTKEKEVAADVKEQAQPLVDDRDGCRQGHRREPQGARAGGRRRRQRTAADSVETVKADAQYAAAEVKDQAHTAKGNVTENY